VVAHRVAAVSLRLGLAGRTCVGIDGLVQARGIAQVGIDQALGQVGSGLFHDAGGRLILAVGRLVALVRLALDAVVFDLGIGVDAAIWGIGCHGVSFIINCMNRNPSGHSKSRNWMMIFCKYFATMSHVRILQDPALTADAMLHAAPVNCPNCFAETMGNFCHQCSQETTLHPPSAREFMHEFIGHYVALEGKLWQSLWLLLLKPGRLTLEYIRGRRVRYVQPLRVYLTFSLIFFAAIKLSGMEIMNTDVDATPPAKAGQAHRPGATLPASENESFQDAARVADRLHHGWGAKTSTFLAQPREQMTHQFSKAFFSYAPYAMFALMPVFALLLKLLYLGTGRRYGEHLLFALHANAFAFAALTLQIVMPEFIPFVHGALGIWMVIYLPLAMRRVYGGGVLVTLLRWIVLSMLHALCIGLAIAATLGLAVVA
jgi:hypothetical protein